jgi:NAD(P)-dependent dehydrogenase (short-subunit alcohol dehydrogenase family)
MHPLRDKIVLITGASSGIGQATALRLAGFGAKLVLASRSQEVLEQVGRDCQARGAEAIAVPTDVTDAEQCRRAVEAAVERFGGLDVLICSAGLSMRAYFESSDLEAMERVMRVNFFGTLYATHFALPHVKRRRGSLVAIASLTGVRGIPSYALYGASKFAIRGLYEALRLELRRDGVHVGVLSPGFVDTPLRSNVLGADGKQYRQPPAPPFRVWPVEKCVDRLVRLIVKRRAEALLPGYVRPLLFLDRMVGSWIGNAVLRWKFPPDSEAEAEPRMKHGRNTDQKEAEERSID